MRKRLLLSAVVAAATLVTMMLPMSPAHADGTTVLTIGPGQYTLGFTHPTGTISVGGGTISARCTAQSAKGRAALATPRCDTRPVVCPAFANSCSFIWNLRESALRGPVVVGGGLLFSSVPGGYTLTVLSPYNCPQPFTCGTRWLIDGVAPGSPVFSSAVNLANPNFPNVFSQVSLYIH